MCPPPRPLVRAAGRVHWFSHVEALQVRRVLGGLRDASLSVFWALRRVAAADLSHDELVKRAAEPAAELRS